MDEIIIQLQLSVNPVTGELLLSKEKTFALFRYLHARVMIDKELDDCMVRLQEFSERFLKTRGADEKTHGSNSI